MTAGNPYEIQYAGPSIEIDECGNLKGAWTLVKGLEYEVWSDEPLYDMKAMRAEGIPGDTEEERLHAAYSRFMRIPRNHSDEFYELARKLTGPQDNWLVQSESICNYLRKNYKYSLEKTSKNSGNYKNAVDRFLFESKQGDCKDFSSAFVMLCRASGIPARLVIGFAPGDFDAASGTRIIKLKNTHAWGEIYFPSYGWVPFDATPTGMLPARQQEEERYFTSVGEKLDSALKMQSVSADKGGSTGGGISIKIGAGKNMTIVIGPWEIVKGLVAVLAVMALSGPLMLVGKHLFLKIRLPRRMHPASKVYCGLLNDLRALGITRNDSQTGSELLQQIEANLQAENVETAAHIKAAVEAFIADYNALYFGGYGTLKQLEQKRSEIKTMLRGSKLIAVQKD
jgi:transglutaminase-like putative cysteine protease